MNARANSRRPRGKNNSYRLVFESNNSTKESVTEAVLQCARAPNHSTSERHCICERVFLVQFTEGYMFGRQLVPSFL